MQKLEVVLPLEIGVQLSDVVRFVKDNMDQLDDRVRIKLDLGFTVRQGDYFNLYAKQLDKGDTVLISFFDDGISAEHLHFSMLDAPNVILITNELSGDIRKTIIDLNSTEAGFSVFVVKWELIRIVNKIGILFTELIFPSAFSDYA